MLDFQVQAQTGYYAVTRKPDPPALISPAPQDWHTEITFNPAESSDWSNTQTFNLNQTSTTPNPTPTGALPNSLVIAGPLIAIIIIVLAVAILHKKKLSDKQSSL